MSDHSYSSPTKSEEQLVTSLFGNTGNIQHDGMGILGTGFHKTCNNIDFSNNNTYDTESSKSNENTNLGTEVLKTPENEVEGEKNMDFQLSDKQKENNDTVDDSLMDSSSPEIESTSKGDDSVSASVTVQQCQSNKFETDSEIENSSKQPVTPKTKLESEDTESGSESVDAETGMEKSNDFKEIGTEQSEKDGKHLNESDSNMMSFENQNGELNGKDNLKNTEIEKENGIGDRTRSKEKEGKGTNNNNNSVATSPLSNNCNEEEMDVTGNEEKESQKSDEDDKGIAIDESNMVKPEDVYGPGKRSIKSALYKDYLNDSDLEENLEEKRRSPSKARLNKSLKENSPGDVFKKLPASSKFHNVDLGKVTEPFKLGWKRELVLRNTFEEFTKSGHRKQTIPGDIYYFSPDGKKLRSMPQVVDYLQKMKSPLSRENFTFFKQPISEPPHESVRHAGRTLKFSDYNKKRKKNSLSSDNLPDDDEPLDKPEIVIERDSDGMVSPLVITSPGNKPIKAKTAKFKLTAKRNIHSMKEKKEDFPPVKMIICPKIEPVEREDRILTAEDVLASPLITDELLMKDTTNAADPAENKTSSENIENIDNNEEGLPPAKKYKPTARKSTTQKAFRSPFRNNIRSEAGLEALCSLNCPGQENIPPDLHCSVCLCLFHPQCVNFQIGSEHAFICLRCSDPDQLQERLKRVKSRQKPTLTAMLSKPPLITSTQSFTTIQNVRIKEEPKDDDEFEKATGQTSTDRVSGVASTEIQSNGGIQQQTTVNNSTDSLSNSNTGVTGETLGSLRTVLDKRSTTTSASQNLPTFLSTPPPNVPNFKTLNLTSPQLVSNSKFIYNHQPSGTQLINTSLLPILRPGQALPVTRIITTTVNAPPLLSNFSSVPTVVQASLPKLSTVVTTLPVISSVYSAANVNSNTTSASVSILPPKLKAAPTAPVTTTFTASPTLSDSSSVVKNSDKESKSGQLLTLPLAVTKRLNLNQPLALKINNMQVIVPPSSFLHTTDGLRVFLPRNTFPVGTGETTKVSVTVTNEKIPSSESSVQFNVNSKTPGNPEEEEKTMSEGLTSSPIHQTSHEKPKQCKKREWKSGVINPGMCFMKRLYGGFDCLMEVFKYLNLKDLARVGMVCQSWRNISMYPSLWKEAKLKGIDIPDWELFVRFLKSRSVESLNLHGLKHTDNPNRTWHQLVAVIDKLTNIRKIHFDLVPALVLHSICPKMPQLEVLTARWISDLKFQESDGEQIWSIPTKLDLSKFSMLTCLQEFRVRGVAGLTLPFNNGPLELASLKNLKILSLTSLKDLGYDELGFLSSLYQLEALEIGDCTSWSSETYFQLGRLCNLKSLRLECGGELPDVGLSDALQNMKNLENLELIMYAVADSLAGALEQLKNLKTIKVWPDTFNYPAVTVNINTLRAVSKAVNLQKLEWGILSNKNSSIILDSESNDSQADDQSENAIMIPVLPDTSGEENNQENTEIMTEYVFIQQFREKISKLLPSTKIKVFSAKMISAREELKR